jgi:hypothetical protein
MEETRSAVVGDPVALATLYHCKILIEGRHA